MSTLVPALDSLAYTKNGTVWHVVGMDCPAQGVIEVKSTLTTEARCTLFGSARSVATWWDIISSTHKCFLAPGAV